MSTALTSHVMMILMIKLHGRMMNTLKVGTLHRLLETSCGFLTVLPAVYGETLQYLDRIADEVEIARLKDMHVLEHEEAQQDLQQLGSDLTAKFVRTWRRKEMEKSNGLDDLV